MTTEALRQEYLKQFNKKEEFKVEITDIQRKNVKIQRKILDAELEIEAMIES